MDIKKIYKSYSKPGIIIILMPELNYIFEEYFYFIFGYIFLNFQYNHIKQKLNRSYVQDLPYEYCTYRNMLNFKCNLLLKNIKTCQYY